jgi:hypothetical protein
MRLFFHIQGYDSNFKAMTFGKSPCTTFPHFLCIGGMFRVFFKDQILANCSAECPAECSSIDYAITTTSAGFPPASLLYYLLGQSETLAKKYFNLSAATFQQALGANQPNLVPSMDVLQTTLKGKLLSLNIFYDDLSYVQIEESEKLSLIDLIAGMGGTLVTTFRFFYEFY